MHFQFQFVSDSLNYFSLFFLLGWVTSLRAVQTCFFHKDEGKLGQILPKIQPQVHLSNKSSRAGEQTKVTLRSYEPTHLILPPM